MNSDDKFFLYIFGGGAMILILSGVGTIIADALNKSHIENMAKAGYIQKVEGTHTIWVKPNAEQP